MRRRRLCDTINCNNLAEGDLHVAVEHAGGVHVLQGLEELVHDVLLVHLHVIV